MVHNIRNLLIASIALTFPLLAANPTLVGTPQVASGGTNTAVFASITHTAGDTLTVFCRSTSTSQLIQSVSNTAGDAWFLVYHDYTHGTGDTSAWLFLARNIIGNANDVTTVTWTASTTAPVCHQYEWGNIAGALPMDGYTTGTTSAGASITVNAITTSFANSAVLVCATNWNNSASVTATGSGFTLQTQGPNKESACSYQIFSVLQSGITPGFTFATGGNLRGVSITLIGTGQNPTFTKVEKITQLHTKISGTTDPANFPWPSFETDANLAVTGSGGSIQNTSTINGVTVPADFVLSTSSTCSSVLDSTGLLFEWEAYTSTTGAIVYWLAQNLNHSTDTLHYRCFGNSAMKNSVSIGSGPWTIEGNYASVMHFSTVQDTCRAGRGSGSGGLPMADSTISAHNACNNTGGVTYPTNAAAQIGKGLNFTVGVNTFLDTTGNGGTANLPTGTNVWTNEQWLLIPNTMGAGMAAGWGKTGSCGAVCGDHETMYWPNSGNLFYPAENNGRGSGGSFSADGVWHYWVGVLPSGTTANSEIIYKDGAVLTRSSLADGTLNLDNTAVVVGGQPGINSFTWTGWIDEFRISKVARSADWIADSYNSMTSGFYTTGGAVNPSVKIHHAVNMN